MKKTPKMYWLRVLTSFHVEAKHDVGFIELPIMREKTTNQQIVSGFFIKRVLRDYITRGKM